MILKVTPEETVVLIELQCCCVCTKRREADGAVARCGGRRADVHGKARWVDLAFCRLD